MDLSKRWGDTWSKNLIVWVWDDWHTSIHSSKSSSQVNKTHSDSSSKYFSSYLCMSSILNRLAISCNRSLSSQLFGIRNLIFSFPYVTFTLWVSKSRSILLLLLGSGRRFPKLGCSPRDFWLWDLGNRFCSWIEARSSASLLALFNTQLSEFSPSTGSSLVGVVTADACSCVPLEMQWLELELWLHEEEGDFGVAAWELKITLSDCMLDGSGWSLCFKVENRLLLDKFGEASSGKFV